jgi:ATP-dependent exoDNAse (exonuclease V) alpha subunit
MPDLWALKWSSASEFCPSKLPNSWVLSNPLACDLLVVDETSMVDVPLMHSLLRALPNHASLIMVGDVDQLPSVGPGTALQNLIESGVISVVRLTEVCSGRRYTARSSPTRTVSAGDKCRSCAN